MALPAQRVAELLADQLRRHPPVRPTIGGDDTFGESQCVARVLAPDARGRAAVEVVVKTWRLIVERQTFVIEGEVPARVVCDEGQDVVRAVGDESSFFARFGETGGLVQVPRAGVTAFYAPKILRCEE